MSITIKSKHSTGFKNFQIEEDIKHNLLSIDDNEEIIAFTAPKDLNFEDIKTLSFSDMQLFISEKENKIYNSLPIQDEKIALFKNNEDVVCQIIPKSFQIIKSVQKIPPNFKNCISRPKPLTLTEGLKERPILFGYKDVSLDNVFISTNNNNIFDLEVSSSKKKKSKKRKHKGISQEHEIYNSELNASILNVDEYKNGQISIKKKHKKEKKSHKPKEDFNNDINSVKSEMFDENLHGKSTHKKHKKKKS